MAPPPFGANSAAARDIATVLHPYTDLQTHQEIGPVVISRGKGVRVWDDAGKEYIESVAGLWCAALGFDNERLVQAAVAQMRKLPFYHAFTAKSHEPMIDLAEMLLARSPVLGRCRGVGTDPGVRMGLRRVPLAVRGDPPSGPLLDFAHRTPFRRST